MVVLDMGIMFDMLTLVGAGAGGDYCAGTCIQHQSSFAAVWLEAV